MTLRPHKSHPKWDLEEYRQTQLGDIAFRKADAIDYMDQSVDNQNEYRQTLLGDRMSRHVDADGFLELPVSYTQY